MKASMQLLAEQFGWQLTGKPASFSGVCTDTRALAGGELFVALAGDNFDAHDFISDAEKAGAAGAVVERTVASSLPLLQTTDTLQGLGKIAKLHRQSFRGKLCAVTGSAGKTSTKEMLATILSGSSRVLATRGNLNNEIGVPLTLLELAPQHAYAVVEMGAAKPGDIAYLANIAEPDVSVLTNALPAHLEGFGSVAQVAKTKGEIYIDQPGKVAVVNLDDAYADYWQGLVSQAQLVTVSADGKESADFSASDINVAGLGCTFMLHSPQGVYQLTLKVPGKHNIANALLAAAAAWAMGLGMQKIIDGLGVFSGVSGRMQTSERGDGLSIIDDSYNANPEAARAAIDVLAELAGRRVMVLGNMAELGPDSDALHRSVGEYAARKNIDLLITVGADAAHAAAGFGGGGQACADFETAVDYLKANKLLAGFDACLVKGSRSARMERIVELLVAGEIA